MVMIMTTVIDSVVISSASVVHSVVGYILLLQNVRSRYVQDFRLDSKMPSAYYTDVYCPNVCERWRRHKYGRPIWHAITFCSCGFFFFLSFCRLFSTVADWMSTTLPQMMWP